MIVLVLAAYAAALFTDFRPVWKSKKPGLIWPCLLLFGLGIILQSLYELKVSVPSPAAPISDFLTGVFNLK